MKQAFLIIAHNEFKLLQLLVEALDNERCDIFVHIDKKCKEWPTLKTLHSKLYVYSEIDVRWGDYSQIECEYSLFKKASSTESYSYYHLLSGVDFPIKPINQILDFFENHKGTEFIDAYRYDQAEVERKVNFYHAFPKDFRSSNIVKRIIRAAIIRVQIILKIRRNKNIEFRKGANWCSITDELVQYIISKEKLSREIFHNTFCADEIFIQTLCWNSPFRTKAFKDEFWGNGNMRHIDWSSGHIKTLIMEDYESIISSDALFARKFSSENMDVIKAIINVIHKTND